MVLITNNVLYQYCVLRMVTSDIMKKASKNSKSDMKSQIKPKAAEASKPSQEKQHEEGDDGRMDFGGLPDRDLKKNLGGCG